MPMETPASPRSTRASVVRLIIDRSATMAMVSRRRRRAAERSWPSLRRARVSAAGRAGRAREDFITIHIQDVNKGWGQFLAHDPARGFAGLPRTARRTPGSLHPGEG